MPTLSSMQIPPPKSWDEFEAITLSALRLRWTSPDLQHHGRSGQKQAGVDIYGEDSLGRPVGVQCKLVQRDPLDLGTVQAELAKAETFVPRLHAFYLATNGPRDALLQRDVRLLSEKRVVTGKFPVGILFWDDLVFDLAKEPRVFKQHYPELLLDLGGVVDITRAAGPPKQTLIVLPVARSSSWVVDSRSSAGMAQVAIELRVTNTSDWQIHIHAGRLRISPVLAVQVGVRSSDNDDATMCPIAPHESVLVSLVFSIEARATTAGAPLITDVALIDQFGNEHWVDAVSFEWRGSPIAKPSSEPLDATQRRVLDAIVAVYLVSGKDVPGRQVRLELRNVGREVVESTLSLLDTDFVRRGGFSHPNERYMPTLLGLMSSSESSRIRAFIEGMLSFLRDKLLGDPAFRMFTSDDLAAAIKLDPPGSVPFMQAVLTTTRLGGGGSAQGDPVTSFRYDVPYDIEDVIDCAGLEAFVALRSAS